MPPPFAQNGVPGRDPSNVPRSIKRPGWRIERPRVVRVWELGVDCELPLCTGFAHERLTPGTIKKEDHTAVSYGKIVRIRRGGYRCAKYNAAGHPRIRVSEADLEKQVLTSFDRLRIQDEAMRKWFEEVLKARVKESKSQMQVNTADLQRQLTSLKNQQDRLLNMRLADEIDEGTFAAKNTEMRDRIARLKSEIQRDANETPKTGDSALKAFELSQTLRDKWVTANATEKRQILETVYLNFRLEGVTLAPTMRKPFDFRQRVFFPNRGDRTPIELFLRFWPEIADLKLDE